jgi:amino acid transporter
VYQWAKAGSSPFAGFMAAWCITTYVVVSSASTGSRLANGFAWAAGPAAGWLGTSKPFALLLTGLFCLISWFVNVRGLHFTKVLSESSAMLWGATALVLLGLFVKALLIGRIATPGAISLTWPGLSLTTIAVLAKIAIGALSGFENSAVFAEECRKPENDVGRSVLIAAPAIALMYIVTTASLLAYTVPTNIDLAAPIQQAIHAGIGSGALGNVMTLALVAIFSYGLIAAGIVLVGMIRRLPMVAGWDGLLPAWWSDLHPTWRTPPKAIAAVSAVIMLLGILSLVGAGNSEAYETLMGAATAALCVMYALLFGVILFGFRAAPERPSLGLRLGALAAFSVAVVSFVLQIVPVGEVGDRATFATKVGATILLTNSLGAYLYWSGARRRRRALSTSLPVAVGDGSELSRKQ